MPDAEKDLLERIVDLEKKVAEFEATGADTGEGTTLSDELQAVRIQVDKIMETLQRYNINVK